MSEVIYKVYKCKPKELIYMTFNVENAIRKYFMYGREDSYIEIWNGQQFVGQYNDERYDLKMIRNDLESILKAS